MLSAWMGTESRRADPARLWGSLMPTMFPGALRLAQHTGAAWRLPEPHTRAGRALLALAYKSLWKQVRGFKGKTGGVTALACPDLPPSLFGLSRLLL